MDCKLLPTYRTQNIYIQVDVYILAAEAKYDAFHVWKCFILIALSDNMFLIKIRIWHHTLLHIKQNPDGCHS